MSTPKVFESEYRFCLTARKRWKNKMENKVKNG